MNNNTYNSCISLYYDQCYNCRQLSILHNTCVDIMTTEVFDRNFGGTNKSFEFLDN